MLRWSLTFLLIAIIAGVLGFTEVAGASVGVARVLFYVFLVLLVLSALLHVLRGNSRD